MGENPAMSDPDQTMPARRWRCWSISSCRIFSSPRLHGTPMWCCPHPPTRKKWGTFTNTNRQVQLGRPVVPPPGEAGRTGSWCRSWPTASGLRGITPMCPSIHGNDAGDAFAEKYHLVAARTRGCGDIPCPAPDKPGSDIIFVDDSRPLRAARKSHPPICVHRMKCRMLTIRWCSPRAACLEHWHTGAMTRRASQLDTLEPLRPLWA